MGRRARGGEDGVRWGRSTKEGIEIEMRGMKKSGQERAKT